MPEGLPLANFSDGDLEPSPSPRLNSPKISAKTNTPEAVTWPDTPRRLLSTQYVCRCMAFICSDVATTRIDPQVLHTPFNTGVNGYAHTMHSFINNGPLEDRPATFSVVPAQAMRVPSGGQLSWGGDDVGGVAPRRVTGQPSWEWGLLSEP